MSAAPFASQRTRSSSVFLTKNRMKSAAIAGKKTTSERIGKLKGLFSNIRLFRSWQR